MLYPAGRVLYYLSSPVWRIVAPSKPVEQSTNATSDDGGLQGLSWGLKHEMTLSEFDRSDFVRLGPGGGVEQVSWIGLCKCSDEFVVEVVDKFVYDFSCCLPSRTRAPTSALLMISAHTRSADWSWTNGGNVGKLKRRKPERQKWKISGMRRSDKAEAWERSKSLKKRKPGRAQVCKAKAWKAEA